MLAASQLFELPAVYRQRGLVLGDDPQVSIHQAERFIHPVEHAAQPPFAGLER